ncbi:MAG TPA: nucleotide sugar dehydrogenase [Streptosporangiaceae bacterium]|nr:nucleotide sugar dehydrogenase [Streptosporangiaceae bacterium]
MSRRPRLTVFGTGYLGTAHAAGLASLGFEVLGVDVDAARARALQAGTLPFYEPGLEPLLREGLRAGRLSFTTSYPAAAEFGDVHFICVGTPQRPGAAGADLSQFESCFTGLAPLLRRPCLVVGKSTVPPGTAAAYGQRLPVIAPAGPGAELAWNPEFLREGHAVADTLRPDRIVAGVWSGRAEATLREVYAEPLAAGVPFLITDPATAEMVKVAANAFLATKISFINAMAEVCEVTGADVLSLADALGRDPRIGGAGLGPGLGFGGGCLPKDIRALAARAAELGAGEALEFLHEIDAINQRRRTRLVDMAREAAGGRLDGRRVGVLGVAFKPGSDDIRDSPALEVAARIRALGARVAVFDPAAMDRARKAHPELDYTGSVLGAAAEADVLLVLTEWPEFSAADPEVLAKTVARRAVVDARHALDADAWRAHGWDYRAPGRPAAGLAAAVTLAPGTRGAGAPGAGPRDAGPRDAGPRDAERHAAEVACLAAAI